jgi:hypothetical protein
LACVKRLTTVAIHTTVAKIATFVAEKQQLTIKAHFAIIAV